MLSWKHITIISPFVLRVFLALCLMSNYGPYSPQLLIPMFAPYNPIINAHIQPV
jgi:hypothetical protein